MSVTPCIDIGVNLTNRRFRNDVDRVIADAWTAGLSSMVITGTSLASSIAAAELCQRDPSRLFSTAGVHPHDAKSLEEDHLQTLEELASRSQVVAIGECGLDYNRDFSPRPQQQQAFARQLELAAACRLPVFLHERDAHDAFLQIIREHRASLVNGVVHCFTGTAAEAAAYLEEDLHIGVTGWICDERRGLELREVVREIPADRLMVETDAPFLAPRDLEPRVRRNEPKYLPHVLEAVARCRGEAVEELAAAVLRTTQAFFGLAAS